MGRRPMFLIIQVDEHKACFTQNCQYNSLIVFVIGANGRSVFHCGDTAYFEGFKEIGERHNIEIALLPIGAYDPPLAREVHMNPEEAVRAFNELKAKTLVPMHYGSFRLGYEPLEEPLERLRESARVHGIEDKVLVMTEGKPVVL